MSHLSNGLETKPGGPENTKESEEENLLEQVESEVARARELVSRAIKYLTSDLQPE